MPRSNGIKLFLLLATFGCIWETGFAQSPPLVIGYERFYADTPSVEGGRILFNELGCVNCHDNPTDLPRREGPILTGILQRKNPEFIRSFLKHPSIAKPGTTMPHLNLTDSDIEKVLHFLGDLKAEKPIPKVFKFVNAERGITLYHEFGCAACHDPSPDFNPATGKPDQEFFTYPSIPLTDLDKKYDINSLSAFLYEPHDFWPQGRMPKFQLDREDGGDLAAFLLNFQNGDATYYPNFETWSSDAELAEYGKAIVNAKQCTACHEVPGLEAPSPKLLTNITSVHSDNPNHPSYELTKNQTASIELFLKQGSTDAPAISHLQTLNCLACHERDGIGGPDTARSVYFAGDDDLGDTGRYPPPLTEIGRKLQPDWLEAAVKGEKQVRPYLRTQMPAFGNSIKGLDEKLSKTDLTNANPMLPASDVEAGRHLLGTKGGLNCITCHDWGEQRSLGIRALDISTISDRLQFEWFHDYLLDPSQFRANTLMPSFWPNGIASNTEILDGNTEAQIASIYAFAMQGRGAPEGFPDYDSLDFEIIPTERPIIQRSFMKRIGTDVLLVGFPAGIHLAFNSATGTPALLWKGRFYDAYTTWFSRFPEFENPLGEAVIRWPTPSQENEFRYLGYRINGASSVEILLSKGNTSIVEAYQPQLSDHGEILMRRTIRFDGFEPDITSFPTHPIGVEWTETTSADPLTRTFLYRW